MALVDEFPIIPHASAGVKCGGRIVLGLEGNLVTLQCNVCGLPVGYVDRGILETLLRLGQRSAARKLSPEELSSISRNKRDPGVEGWPLQRMFLITT
jgi:hypothetical protein